jgi:hypothetical protein
LLPHSYSLGPSRLTAKGYRARDGAHLVACNTITFQDGRELTVGAGNIKGYGKN